MNYLKISMAAIILVVLALAGLTYRKALLLSERIELVQSSCDDIKNYVSEGVPKSDRSRYDSGHSEESVSLRAENYKMATLLVQAARKKGWTIATAESVSGGNLASVLAWAPGAGSVFAGGAVCYKIEAKRKLLAVPDEREDDLYDLQTARDMAKGAQKLYEIRQQEINPEESYFQKPVMAIATTGRAVSYPGKWEGGVYVAIALPGGEVVASYFPHTFVNSRKQPDVARTKDEGMLVASQKAILYALEWIEK